MFRGLYEIASIRALALASVFSLVAISAAQATEGPGSPTDGGGGGGSGVVFKLIPPVSGQTGWTESVLYRFNVSTSGDTPVGEMVRDPGGHMYGVTRAGGPSLLGTVFEITS
jgi:hypothetical protein